MTTPLKVAEEAERNLERLRESTNPIPEACQLLAVYFQAMPFTLAQLGLAYALGDRDLRNLEAMRVIANHVRRCADMLDLACDRHEKENL